MVQLVWVVIKAQFQGQLVWRSPVHSSVSTEMSPSAGGRCKNCTAKLLSGYFIRWARSTWAVLLLLCNHLLSSSHPVVKGSIRNVSHDSENHMSQVDVSVQRVYRQKNWIFQQEEGSGEWRGLIQTLLQCQVKKGGGDFLFTGNEHFGEAWLGCAPRFKDFLLVYQAARERGANPCEFEFNWHETHLLRVGQFQPSLWMLNLEQSWNQGLKLTIPTQTGIWTISWR